MKMDRRQFLAATVAGASGMLLGCTGMAERQARAAAPPNPYEIVPLGKTGIKVSRIGFGTGMRGGMRESNQTRMGREKFEGLLKAAYERGIRLFDMADMYGTHTFVAGAMKGLPRDKVVYSTKIWMHRGGIPETERLDANILVDRFRKELGTDYVDLVLIHCMMSGKWADDFKKQMDILDELKSKKIIRAHGISCHSLDAMRVAAASPWVDSIHARINAYGEKMDGPPQEVAPLLKTMRAAGKGVVGMKLVGEGTFRNDPEKRDGSIRFVLDQGCADTMVVGFEKIEEVDDFAARVAKAMAARASA